MDPVFTEDIAQADAIELRVVHGPQAGSTLPLERGQDYTLGTSDTCAVLLAGTKVEAEHASLAADGDGIQVTLLQGKVTTIDRSEVSSGQVVALGTVLRLGRITLTVDSVDAPWPHEDALEEPEAVAVVPQQHVDEAEVREPEPELAMPAQALPAAATSRKRNMVVSLLLGTAATVAMGAAVAAWVTSDERQPPGGDGTAVLLPVTSSPADSRATSASAPAPVVAVPRVLQGAERLALVTEFVARRRVAGEMELNVQQAANGRLRVSGAASTREAVAAMLEAARTELAQAAPIDYAVLPRAELPARFEERLHAAGLAPKFRVLRRAPNLELEAVLKAGEVRVWESMFAEFSREYGSVLTVRAQVQHERDALEGQIEAVVAGAFPYVLTTGGRRVSPGGLMDGRTLTTIRDGELVFSDGLRVRYAN